MMLFIPDELEHQRDDIRRFFDAMLYKLRKNAHKSKTGKKWASENQLELVTRIKTELAELEKALEENNSIEVTLECADLANFALILANTALEAGQPS